MLETLDSPRTGRRVLFHAGADIVDLLDHPATPLTMAAPPNLRM